MLEGLPDVQLPNDWPKGRTGVPELRPLDVLRSPGRHGKSVAREVTLQGVIVCGEVTVCHPADRKASISAALLVKLSITYLSRARLSGPE